MSAYDDSHILLRLGILDSTEPSPKRTEKNGSAKQVKSSESFVNVNLVQGGSEDEDALFDRDELLSSGTATVTRRVGSDSFMCKLILLFSLSVCAGLTFGLFSEDEEVRYAKGTSLFLLRNVGLLLGFTIARSLVKKMNWIYLTFCSSLTLFSTSFLFFYSSSNRLLLSFSGGCAIGIILYCAIVIWFSVWRSNPKYFLFIWFSFSLGTALLSWNLSVDYPAVFHAIPISVEPTVVVENTSFVKKPLVATGAIVVESKTLENQLKSRNSSIDYRDVSAVSTPISTTESSLDTDSSIENLSGMYICAFFLILNLLIHVTAIMCCCIPIQLVSEQRVLKLCNMSQSGLRLPVLVRISVFYFICGCCEELFIRLPLESHSQFLFTSSATVARFISLLFCFNILSQWCLWSVVSVIIVSGILLVFSLFTSLLALISSSTLALLEVVVFVFIDNKMKTRPLQLLDVTLFSLFLGQSTVVFFFGTMSTGLPVLVGTLVVLATVFFLVMRSVLKTARLREIMEYSGQPITETDGDYFHLVETLDDDSDNDTISSS